MSRLVPIVALAFLLSFTPAMRAGENPAQPPETERVGQTTAPAPTPQASEHTPFEWFLVLAFLALSLTGGGYTLICYLKRRDTLSLLESMESRRHFSSGSNDFMG